VVPPGAAPGRDPLMQPPRNGRQCSPDQSPMSAAASAVAHVLMRAGCRISAKVPLFFPAIGRNGKDCGKRVGSMREHSFPATATTRTNDSAPAS